MAAYSDGAEQLDHHKTPKTMRGNVVWSTVHFHITHQTPEPHVSAILLQSDPGLGPGLLSCGRHLPEQEGEPGAEAPVQAGISMPVSCRDICSGLMTFSLVVTEMRHSAVG